MLIHTASEGITLSRKLENDSAKFYEALAQQFPKDAETFQSFARENKKNIAQIERTYYGVITDAIEGCFAFNMDPDSYTFPTTIPEGASYAGVLNLALQIEEKIVKFYAEAAKQSECLLADVPRAFIFVVRKRGARITLIKSLLGKAG